VSGINAERSHFWIFGYIQVFEIQYFVVILSLEMLYYFTQLVKQAASLQFVFLHTHFSIS